MSAPATMPTQSVTATTNNNNIAPVPVPLIRPSFPVCGTTFANEWTKTEEWLNSLSVSASCIVSLKQNEVTLKSLPLLKENDFTAIGIKIGALRTIMQAIPTIDAYVAGATQSGQSNPTTPIANPSIGTHPRTQIALQQLFQQSSSILNNSKGSPLTTTSFQPVQPMLLTRSSPPLMPSQPVSSGVTSGATSPTPSAQSLQQTPTIPSQPITPLMTNRLVNSGNGVGHASSSAKIGDSIQSMTSPTSAAVNSPQSGNAVELFAALPPSTLVLGSPLTSQKSTQQKPNDAQPVDVKDQKSTTQQQSTTQSTAANNTASLNIIGACVYCHNPLSESNAYGVNMICGKNCPMKDQVGGWYSQKCFAEKCGGNCGRSHNEDDPVGCLYCLHTDHVYDFCANENAYCKKCQSYGHTSREFTGTKALLLAPNICVNEEQYVKIEDSETGSFYWS
jgi:hypothetical protein